MSDRSIPLIDRLRERGLIDRWGFLAFTFVGGAGILIAKVVEVPAEWVAIGASAIILLYAFVVHWAGTGRLRSDQAGDNCYYLGLIFTLVSLAYAIFTFDPGDTATTIVQGFGIALFTTILGLALRVFFNQSRVDLEETEDSVRIELTEAASRLRAQLSQIVVQMNDFGHQTVQSLSELREAISIQVTGATENVQKASAAARETINTEATETASRIRKLATATDKATAGLERQNESVRAIEEASRGMAASVGAVAELATATKASLTGLSGHVEQLSGLYEALQGSNRTLTESVAGLHAAIVRRIGRAVGPAPRRASRRRQDGARRRPDRGGGDHRRRRGAGPRRAGQGRAPAKPGGRPDRRSVRRGPRDRRAAQRRTRDRAFQIARPRAAGA